MTPSIYTDCRLTLLLRECKCKVNRMIFTFVFEHTEICLRNTWTLKRKLGRGKEFVICQVLPIRIILKTFFFLCKVQESRSADGEVYIL